MSSNFRFVPLRITLIQIYAQLRRMIGFRRGTRLINWLYPKLLRQHYPIETSIKYGAKFTLRINTISHLEWALFLNGIYEPHLIKIFKRFVQNGDVVIDVGANIGVHTLALSEVVGKTGKVIAIEPYPPALNKLKNNLSGNHINNVDILTVALSLQSGKAELTNPEGNHNEGMATLWQAKQQGNHYSYEVRLETLDNLMEQHQIESVKLIKMDIQGSEYPALRGGERLIRRFRPFIIFEYDKSWEAASVTLEEMQTYLESLDYILYAINESDASIIPVDQNKHTEFIAIHRDNMSVG